MYFNNVRTLEELRKEYKRLAKIYHPDCGGDADIFKAIQSEYEKRFEELEKTTANTSNAQQFNKDLDKAIREAIERIINLDVDIEVCGSWVWVSGNTYPVKEQLKAAGYTFIKKRVKWAWHEEGYKKRTGKDISFDEIRNRYGSETINHSRHQTQRLATA